MTIQANATNPLFNDNKLKLGIFGYNGNGPQMTAALERFVAEWPRSRNLAALAAELGFEAVVSFAVWRAPIDGDGRHLANREFEAFSWCAGIGAAVDGPAVIATFHAQLTNPAFVAKAAATIDHITNGRVALNIVAGSSRHAFGQFGRDIEDPATRYAHAEEFLEVLKRFWVEQDEFEFTGRFYQVRKGVSLPKPLQAPHPPIMNAGLSDRGRRFATRHADLVFTLLRDQEDSWAPQIAAYHNLARTEFRRDIQVWTHGYVVIGDTDAHARAYLNSYAEERADPVWVKAWVDELSEGMPALRPEQLFVMRRNWAAGGGFELVGSAETVARKLIGLSAAGLSGFLLTALEPEKMLRRFGAEVMPRLEQAGLRRAAHALIKGPVG